MHDGKNDATISMENSNSISSFSCCLRWLLSEMETDWYLSLPF